MDNFSVIYKILKLLEASMDADEFDERSLLPEALQISPNRRLSILKMLLEEGLIAGFSIDEGIVGNFLVSKGKPRITLKGLQYLDENSRMKRAMRLAKGIKESIPGV